MMKIKNFAVKAALLVESLLTLTACTDKNTEKNAKTETKITSVDLELDAEETTQKIYHAHFNLGEDDELAEFSENFPSFAKIKNKKENYCIDLTFEIDTKEDIEEFFLQILLTILWKINNIIITEPNTPLNDADHVGSFNYFHKIGKNYWKYS